MVGELTVNQCYLDRSHFGWAIKDSASRYLYANALACAWFNLPAGAIAGLRDTDLTPDIGDHYHYILHDDKKILTTRVMSVVLKTFNYGSESRLKSFRVEKRPWTLSDGTPGIICTYLEITNVYFSTFLGTQDRKSCVFTRPATLFTDKEWEVILLLLCGVKQKTMPEILGISASALRNRLTRCYDKSGAGSNAALKAQCIQAGWDNYIPPFFLNKGYVRIS